VSTSSAEKIKEKRERIINFAKGTSGEPLVTEENYKLMMCEALNYYNIFEDNKTKRKWVRNYCLKNGLVEELSLVDSDIGDYHFSQIGTVVRLLDRGQYVSESHKKAIFNKFSLLKQESIKVKKSEEVEKKKATIVDRTQVIVDQCMDKINGEIDHFIINRSSDFDMVSYLKANDIPTSAKKIIAEELSKTSRELASINPDDEDDQMFEGYSNYSKKDLKKYREIIDGIISACSHQVRKTTRKTQKVKVKPTSIKVGKLQYAESTNVGGVEIKSVKPESLIGAKEAWFYHIKYKIVHVYKSEKGISVKGSKLTDFIPEISLGKRIKNPEKFLSGNLAQKTLNESFSNLLNKSWEANGRISSDMIILKVF
jgi:hypothetical protein